MKLYWMFGFLGVAAIGAGCGGGGSTSSGGTAGTGGSTASTGGTLSGTGATGGTGGATTGTGATGGTGGMATTTGTGGSPGEACNSCVQTKEVFKMGTDCGNKNDACVADQDCALWLKCQTNCIMMNFTSECFAACDQAESVVSTLYLPLYECACAACKTECAPACP